MKLPVYLYGHPVLRKECTDITSDHEGLKDLIANMFETMYASEGSAWPRPRLAVPSASWS